MARKKADKTNVKPAVEDTVRSSAGLRAALFDELDNLRKGQVTSSRANAVAKLASTIVETVRMELDVAKAVKREKLPADRDSGKALMGPSSIPLAE